MSDEKREEKPVEPVTARNPYPRHASRLFRTTGRLPPKPKS